MKKFLLASAALAALNVGAVAADLGSRRLAPAPIMTAAPFSWTGFYVGAVAGYGWTDNRASYSFAGTDLAGVSLLEDTLPTGLLPTRLGARSNGGFTGGLTAGYNYQTGGLVFGVEADIVSLQRHRTTNVALQSDIVSEFDALRSQSGGSINPNTIDTLYAFTATNETRGSAKWLSTARARVGFAHDRALFFVTGGLAVGGVSSSSSTTINVAADATKVVSGVTVGGFNALSLAMTGERSTTRYGWALGAGFEYALTNNISVKGEYLHYDLGKISYALAPTAATAAFLSNPLLQSPGIAGRARASINGDLVRVGLNYRF